MRFKRFVYLTCYKLILKSIGKVYLDFQCTILKKDKLTNITDPSNMEILKIKFLIIENCYMFYVEKCSLQFDLFVKL